MTQSIKDDAFKHVTTSTPIKEGHENRKETRVLLLGGTYLNVKNLKKMVCSDCAKKMYIKEDPDFFMCIKCQWYIRLRNLAPFRDEAGRCVGGCLLYISVLNVILCYIMTV